MAKKKKPKISQLKKKRAKNQKRQAKVRQKHLDKHQEQVEQGLVSPRKSFKWREFTQKGKLQAKVKSESKRLSAWYMDQSLILKIGLGLIIIPILIALFLLQGVILPFLATAFTLMLAISKLAFIWIKGGAFIVYISYKVFKGLLGVYYCISRSITGWEAQKQRGQQAQLPVSDDAIYPALKAMASLSKDLELKSTWKALKLGYKKKETVILFSYLRYFIIGQIFMYKSFWFDKMSFLTLWRVESRARVKEIFTTIGKTIFTPHLLGVHLNKKRILVPGDAKLLGVQKVPNNEEKLIYHLEVKWLEWSFDRKWPFIHSSAQQEQWFIKTESALDLLKEDEVGYQLSKAEIV